MPMSPKLYTWLCGCFVALGSVMFGYDLGVIAGVLPAEDFLRTANYPNEDYLGFITSSLLLGAFVGCIPSAYIADAYGRRKAVFVGGLIFIFGGALQTGAKNGGMILAGRFFAGFAIGQLSFLAPLYQSEIAHPSIRGRLTTLQQFALGWGAFFASFAVYGMQKHHAGTALQWRLPLGLQIVPAVPLVALIFLFPESPRWLCKVGRHDDSIAALARLHARGDINDTFVVAEFEEIRLALEDEARQESAWRQIFFNSVNFRRVFLGIALQFSVQMTGVSVLQYYSVTIFESMGFTSEKTLLFQSINSVIALLGELCCILFVDRLGRRWPLIVANVISSATFAISTALQKVYPASSSNDHAKGAFVAMTWIFNLAFSAAIGPISWAYPVEVLNTSIRAKGTALTSMSAWISNFLIAQVTPHAFAQIGWRYYMVFAILAATNAIFVWLFFPETKGRTLEEMDDFFSKTHWIVPLATYVPTDAQERERELREGKIRHGGVVETINTGHNNEKDSNHSKERALEIENSDRMA